MSRRSRRHLSSPQRQLWVSGIGRGPAPEGRHIVFPDSFRSLRELPLYLNFITHSWRCGLLIGRPLRGLVCTH